MPLLAPLRLLHVITGLNVGGAEAVLLRLISHLRTEGVQQSVVVLLGEGPLTPRIRELGIECLHLGLRRGSLDIIAIRKLKSAITSFQPAIVHAWMYHACLCAAVTATNLPVLWSIHHASLAFAANTLSTLGAATLCGVLSYRRNVNVTYCARSAISAHARCGYSMRRTSFIPNGYNAAEFARSNEARALFRARLNIAPDALVVGMVARFDPIKDHATFFHAAEILARQNSTHIVFLLLGEGIDDSNPALTNMVAASGLRSVILGGRCDDMASAYSAMDLLALSSKSEAFPNVLCEGMLCELPCVATDVGDCKTIIGDCGFTAQPDSPKQLAEALGSALRLPVDERLRMGLAARKRISDAYSEKRFLSEYLAVYATLADGASLAPFSDPRS